MKEHDHKSRVSYKFFVLEFEVPQNVPKIGPISKGRISNFQKLHGKCQKISTQIHLQIQPKQKIHYSKIQLTCTLGSEFLSKARLTHRFGALQIAQLILSQMNLAKAAYQAFGMEKIHPRRSKHSLSALCSILGIARDRRPPFDFCFWMTVMPSPPPVFGWSRSQILDAHPQTPNQPLNFTPRTRNEPVLVGPATNRCL